jgi:hypothetical protein
MDLKVCKEVCPPPAATSSERTTNALSDLGKGRSNGYRAPRSTLSPWMSHAACLSATRCITAGPAQARTCYCETFLNLCPSLATEPPCPSKPQKIEERGRHPCMAQNPHLTPPCLCLSLLFHSPQLTCPK